VHPKWRDSLSYGVQYFDMRPLHHLFFAFLLVCGFLSSQAQTCPIGQVPVEIIFQTDSWGYETSWTLINGSDGSTVFHLPFNTYGNNTTDTTRLCVPEETCMLLEIEDSFGDGIYLPGGYTVYYDGSLTISGAVSGYTTNADFGCPPGTSCNTALPINLGLYTAPLPNTWYVFTPDSAGTYGISTCGLNTCDTRIWVYDDCEGIDLSAAEEGTLYYSNDDADCATQARIPNAILAPGIPYYIRIGDFGGGCAGGAIQWELSYNGPVVGCTDPAACNYSPLATVSDTCIYPGSPECPNGPDLTILKDPLVSSMSLGFMNVSIGDCLVAEECVTGYGLRDIISFDTYIYNQGNEDYYIGNPSANPDQFDLINCHGHTHYKGYAEYILFDEAGAETPVGFKNGFCVMDIWCPFGTATYGCGTMGVSAGCADIYGSGTTCNWIDITDVDTGRYTFVARTNWERIPDGLGHHETNYSNNWAQVCIVVGEDAFGNRFFTTDTLCDPYTDCLGEIYGAAQPDCNGDCAGLAKMGDLSGNQVQDSEDVDAYISGIIGEDLLPTSCVDLNSDDRISVSDAALLSSCLYFSAGHPHSGGEPHDHCNLPSRLINIFDTVQFRLGAVDFEAGWIDVEVRNPYNDLVGYEITVSGLNLLKVESLTNEAGFYHRPEYALGGQRVLGLNRMDSTLARSLVWKPLCRLYWFDLTATEICLVGVEDAVNQLYEQVLTKIEGNCRPVTASGIDPGNFNPVNVQVYPNPSSDVVHIQFPHQGSERWTLEVFNSAGQIAMEREVSSSDLIDLAVHNWPLGLYRYRLQGSEFYSGSFVVIR
jgi:hypothetical protein